MMSDVEVTMIMDYQLTLWGLYVFIQSQQLRPPSTPPTTREHTVPSLPSHQGNPGMSCLSIESIDT